MIIDDIEQVLHNLYLELFLARDVAPVREIAQLEARASLVSRIIAACSCSTPAIMAELGAHPEADAVAEAIYASAASRVKMEEAARAMMAEAAALTIKLRDAK